MKKVLRYRTLDEMREIFDEQDRDHSNTMDARELLQLFASLQVNLTEPEVNKVLEEVDESGDGVLSFEEVINWMKEKELWDPEKAGEVYTPPDLSADMHAI